jgi:hypothetical protein
MRHFVLLAALLLARAAAAQTVPAPGAEAAMPFKGANTIVVHTPDSATVALQKLGRLMVVQGYTMDKFDAALGYLATKGKPVGQLTPAVYSYTAVAMKEAGATALYIKGTYAFPVGARTLTESMFWTKGNLPHAKQCFSAVEKVALAYPAARIGYVYQP